MHSSRATTLILLLALFLAGCPRGVKLPEQSGVGGLMVFDYSGITVMHQYSARDYIHIRVHFGWQRPEESSYAAQSLAVEAAFSAGAGDLSPAAFAARLESVGATLDFLPGRDGPVVVMNCLPERLDGAWELLTLCLADPQFDKDAYQSLRAARIATQKAAEADHAHQAFAAAREESWPESGLGKEMGGSAAEFEASARITAQATFRDLMRQRCNIRLVTVGPIEAERISDLLLTTVDALPDGECTPSEPTLPEARLQQTRLVHETRGTQAVAGIFPGPKPESPSAIPMRLVMQMVEKRLRDNVVRHHIATHAEASYVAAPPGYNLIQITGSNAFQCAEFCLSELRRLKTNGFSEAEVTRAKQSLQAQIALGYEAAPSLAAKLDAAAELGVTQVTGHEQLLLETANAKTLTTMLRQYLTGISWGIVGDTTHIDRKSLQRL